MIYTIDIASVPDRDSLVAEIWHNTALIAEVSQETGELVVQLFATDNLHGLTELSAALMEAGDRLKKLDNLI